MFRMVDDGDKFMRIRSEAQLIRPNLYLTNTFFARKVQNLRDINVTHVVACGFEQPTPFPKEVVYHKINIADNPGQDLSRHFADALDFMYQATQNGVCLVHCSAGGSRSVAMIMAFLVVVDQYTTDQALAHIYEKRPGVAPNFGFVNQLKDLETDGCGWKPQTSHPMALDDSNASSSPRLHLTQSK